ncbi:homeobox domain-containing protein [Paramyrothecium foliicola]|nr:homeobox domain-containing protein [Paramyrothecium foliicola]
MSLLAMAPPSHHAAFQGDYSWDASRSLNRSPPLETPGGASIALPSIRQLFAEIETTQPKFPSQGLEAKSSHANVPTSLNTSEYVHSPASSKRRRTSFGGEEEPTRPRQVPRLYGSPELATQRRASPNYHPKPISADAWASSSRRSPFSGPAGPAGTVVDSLESVRGRSPASGHSAVSSAPKRRDHFVDEKQNLMPASSHPLPGTMDPPPETRAPTYAYQQQHHPSRYQSLSTGSIRPYDRSPFTAGGYPTQYQDVGQYVEVGGMGFGADTKQRKRRGNLPKETTDKLRAWFVAHLQHPYPTEDEKQELMRQTGLQMNQISNWFINARRRQLPAMISNARAESEMMHGRVSDGKALPGPERGHYRGEEGKRDRGPLADDSGFYEEDAESYRQRAAAVVKRGSV